MTYEITNATQLAAVQKALMLPFIDVSLQLVAGSQAAASANATAIQTALNTASAGYPNTVKIDVPGTYYVAQIVVPSNVNLYIGAGVMLKKPDSTIQSMFINEGALQGTPARDTNIGFYGPGTIDGNATNQTGLTRATSPAPAANTFLYGIQGEVAMIGVDGFVFEVGNVYNLNGYAIQFSGTNGRVRNVSVNTRLDFLHITGPSSHIEVDNCYGYSVDDFIAVNAWDWHVSNPTVGDITDVHISNVAYYGSSGVGGVTRSGCLMSVLAGTRTTGYGTGTGNVRNISLSGFNIDLTKGQALSGVAPAAPGLYIKMDLDQVNGSEWSGVGLVENVTIRDGYCSVPNVNCYGLNIYKYTGGTPADGQNTLTIRNYKVENVHFDASVGSATAQYMVNATTAYNTVNVENLIFRDCQWTPAPLASDQAFVKWANKTMADRIVVDGLTINSSSATGNLSAVMPCQYGGGVASVINDLTVDRVATAPGYQIPLSWFLFAGGVVNKLRSRGNYIVGPSGGSDGQGIYLNSSTSQILDGVVSDSYFSGVKQGLQINNAVGSGNAAVLEFNNCLFTTVVHPVYVNGAFNADVRFVGCNITTASNLARVATGALILALLDTIVSGAGNNTVTLVTAGTVRLRKTDRVSMLATIVQTPSDGDLVYFAATPAYTGVNVISGTGAGLYVYRGTGTVGWIKLN